MDLYDPGSVFKLPAMMAMLEESNMPLTATVTTGGKYTIYGETMTDSHDYGTLTAQAVIERSSNIGMIKLMQRIFGAKPRKWYDYLKGFHMLDPLDFQKTLMQLHCLMNQTNLHTSRCPNFLMLYGLKCF